METNHFWLVPVNYLAVLLCAVSNMIVGYLWYGPLFGKEWEKLVGLTAEKKAKAKKSMAQTYSIMFITALIMAYVLFHFIWYAAPGSYTLFIAVKTAVWAWLGFVATVSLTKYLFTPDKKPINLLFIETGYQLVALILMGTIFYILK
jgi:hypothetical protein